MAEGLRHADLLHDAVVDRFDDRLVAHFVFKKLRSDTAGDELPAVRAFGYRGAFLFLDETGGFGPTDAGARAGPQRTCS